MLFVDQFIHKVVEPLNCVSHLSLLFKLVLSTLLWVKRLIQELGVRIDLRILLADLVRGRIFKSLHY